jgi:catalase
MTIDVDETNYHPNTISDNYPLQSSKAEGGFTSHHERIDAYKVRTRSKSFLDHYSQAILFYNSQTEVEKRHIGDAFSFELGKVKRIEIRRNILKMIRIVNKDLAKYVSDILGIPVPEGIPENMQHSPDASPEEYETIFVKPTLQESPALSILKNQRKDNIRTRRVAILCNDGVDGEEVYRLKKTLLQEGAFVRVVAKHFGTLTDRNGKEVNVDDTVLTTSSVLFDATIVPSGSSEMFETMTSDSRYKEFVRDTYRHYKPLASNGLAVEYIRNIIGDDHTTDKGVVYNGSPEEIVKAIKHIRFWNR